MRRPSRVREQLTAVDRGLGTRHPLAERLRRDERLRARKAALEQLAMSYPARLQPFRSAANLHHDRLSGGQSNAQHRREVPITKQHLVDARAQVDTAPPIQVPEID